MKAGNDMVILRAEKTQEATVEVAGGNKIYRDTTFDENEYRCNYAEVVSVPDRLTDAFVVFQDTAGETFFHDSFPMEIQVGDTAIVDWSALHEDNEVADGHYRVPYKEIYAVERNGEIIPLNSYVFLEQYFGEGVVEENGVMCRVNAAGLVTTTDVSPLPTQAKVAYIGKNIAGNPPVLPVGSLAFCDLEWAATLNIHGKEYYAVRQQDLWGELVK